MKRQVTQDDLDLNPELVEQGVKVGDEIEFPENDGLNEEGEDGPGSQPQGPETGKPKDPPDEP